MHLIKRRIKGMMKYEIVNTPIVIMGCNRRMAESGSPEWHIYQGNACLSENSGPYPTLASAEYEVSKFIEEAFKTLLDEEKGEE